MTTISGGGLVSIPSAYLTVNGTNVIQYSPATSVGSLDWNVSQTISTNKSKTEISARLYFKFMKKKMEYVNVVLLKERMQKLAYMVEYADILEQPAMYEELCKSLAICIKEIEIESAGINLFISPDLISKYKDKVKKDCIRFKNLKDYPRILPLNVKEKIGVLRKLNLFDDFYILYTDFSKQEDLKTTKDKIVEKDPILFGVSVLLPNKNYFIADWIDEHCDLTLSKFIDVIQIDNPTFKMDKIEPLSQNEFTRIKNQAVERAKKLKETNRDNWRAQALAEEKGREEKLPRYKRFLKKLFNL